MWKTCFGSRFDLSPLGGLSFAGGLRDTALGGQRYAESPLWARRRQSQGVSDANQSTSRLPMNSKTWLGVFLRVFLDLLDVNQLGCDNVGND